MTDQMTDEKPAPAPDSASGVAAGAAAPDPAPARVASPIIGLVLFGFSRVLLSIIPHAATAVALIVAVSIMVVAIVVASRQRLSNGSLFSMIGSDRRHRHARGRRWRSWRSAPARRRAGGPQVVALAAPKGAAANGLRTDQPQFEAANQPTDLEFDNQDPGIQHNVVIFGEDPADEPAGHGPVHRRRS